MKDCFVQFEKIAVNEILISPREQHQAPGPIRLITDSHAFIARAI